ncbi:hypothetical protein Tco_1531949 [Tanacetum coccineum]
MKKHAKFVRDLKSLGKEAGESLAKHAALEWEIERLLRAVVSEDIMSIVQNTNQVSEQNDTTKGTSVNTQFCKQSILGNHLLLLDQNSMRTHPTTVSQPHVITKKDVNSDSNGLSSTGVDNIAKTKRLQP